MIRRLRANLLDELQKQYVVTARAKGMKGSRLLIKYPLRMALNPFIADIGNLLPQMISGSAIVAYVMSLPTSGPMLISALQSQDQYLAGSFLLFLAFLTVVGMLVSDLALAVLDPRIRLGAEANR
jgi:peptide/nickel transport system permease protein